MKSLADLHRFGLTERWAGVLRQELGSDYWVIEEGLNGRTTVWDDPVEGVHKNGRTYLTPCLESHAPIDLVVLALGSNDLKKRYSVSAYDIALSVDFLINLIQKSAFGPEGGAPQVLLICPPPLVKMGWLDELFECGGHEKSRKLPDHYREIARSRNCVFLNAGDVIVSSDVDGIHFDVGEHRKLGLAVASVVKQILA